MVGWRVQRFHNYRTPKAPPSSAFFLKKKAPFLRPAKGTWIVEPLSIVDPLNSRRFAVVPKLFALSAVILAAMPGSAQTAAGAADLAASAQKQLPALTETYKHLHENPELSGHEVQTAAYVAAELSKLGYAVTAHVGKYADGTQAEGVVAVLENGAGPRLLLRTELDALPVEEKTGLDYASHVKTANAQGQAVSVMHACGHDLHMTVLLGVARELMERKSQWHGTVMLIGQPAEETIGGAEAMLRDHLYERFGRPDYVIAEHDSNDVAAGTIAVKGGPLLASATGINVTMRGIGGHGSAPQSGKDPIVLAAEFVLVAQTIVSHGAHAADLLRGRARQDCGGGAARGSGTGGGVWDSRGPDADGRCFREHAGDDQRRGACGAGEGRGDCSVGKRPRG